MGTNVRFRPIAVIRNSLHSYEMIRNGLVRMGACAILMCALGSCTRDYTVDVVLRGNQVVFKFVSGWFDRPTPAAVRHLWVRQLSTNSPAVWKLESIDYNGRTIHELGYGVLPSGMKVKVKAAPLRVGQVYRIEMLAIGGGGSQQFVILPGPGRAQPITVLQQ